MSNTKKKVSNNRREARKTSGGPPPEEISSMEDQVVGIIGDTPKYGIDGGIDTASFTETSMDLSMPSCSSSRRSSYSSADESGIFFFSYSSWVKSSEKRGGRRWQHDWLNTHVFALFRS